LKQNDTLGIYLPPKPRFMDCSVHRTKELKKSTRCGNFTPTPTLYP